MTIDAESGLNSAAAPGMLLFETERLTMYAVSAAEARELFLALCQDEALSTIVPAMNENSGVSALEQAFEFERQCGTGEAKAWRIVERIHGVSIGAVVARDSVEGIHIAAMIAAPYGDRGFALEAKTPIMAWLEANDQPDSLRR